MLQHQRQRELQRLTLTGALTSTPNSPMIAQSPNLLSSATASPLQGGQGGCLFGLQDNALHKPGVSDTAGFLIMTINALTFSFLEISETLCDCIFRLQEKKVETRMGDISR